MKPVESQIDIDAPPERVFQIVTDLDRYPEWNHFTPRITLATKDLKVGAELDLDCQMTEHSLLVDEHEVILALEPARFAFGMGTSRTRGRPGIVSQRWQVCEPLNGGARTHIRNWEQFNGLISPLVWLLYAGKLQRAFARYCRDLKARAEGKG